MQGETRLFRDHSAIRPISIHSPHAGRDSEAFALLGIFIISIHSPHAGRDLIRRSDAKKDKFQSTLPMRGETDLVFFRVIQLRISIHSPHAGRDNGVVFHRLRIVISIHSPHAGRDYLHGI